MQKWLNDLHAIIIKQGFDPDSGGGSGGSGGGTGVLIGKYLGDNYTTEQKQAIANGTFNGLNIGDYWIINGVTWRIADFDYYYNVGDTAFTKHHVVIIPDSALYNAQMRTTSNQPCYSGSDMYITNLDNARSAFDNAFGSSFIPSHRGLYSNAISGSNASAYTWRDMRIELMNEVQLLGHCVWSQNVYDIGSQKTQFRLFVLDQNKINIRQDYWLTNVFGSASFICMNEDGSPKTIGAINSCGVRPFACIVGDPEQ